MNKKPINRNCGLRSEFVSERLANHQREQEIQLARKRLVVPLKQFDPESCGDEKIIEIIFGFEKPRLRTFVA